MVYKVVHKLGYNRCITGLWLVRKCTVFCTNFADFSYAPILQDRSQKRLPFRICDSCYFQKNWFNREKTYFIPPKNEVAQEKNEVHI